MTAPRKRARQACLFCNARRVKCNVADSLPCDNCVAAQRPCQLRESRRGKYARRRPASIVSPDEPQNTSNLKSSETNGLDHSNFQTPGVPAASLSPRRHSNSSRPDGNDQFDEYHFSQSIPIPVSPHETPNGEKDSVFLGESTFVRYMQDETCSTQSGSSPSESGRLRHPLPKAEDDESLPPSWEVSNRCSRTRFLTEAGALSFPKKNAVEVLLQAYFRCFHPCFAIVDENDILTQLQNRSVAPLLLQSMLFVGTIYCEDRELQRTGLGNRHQSKHVFYTHAKDIYDAEIETSKVIVVQSLFLLSFRRAGATVEKDARHWLGAAMGLAQSKAMHRSGGSLTTKEQQLRKRLWWSIYIRERQCAAALGLPNRVRDEDCDVEPLNEKDFEHAFNPSLSKCQVREYTQYAIQMATLSRILGQIVHCGYLPGQSLTSTTRELIKNELLEWNRQFAPPLQPDAMMDKQASSHANMLHLAYNNLLILLYRSDFIEAREDSVNGQMAVQAAARNAHIVEDILASPQDLRDAQIHVITNLFNSLCIHTLRLRRLLKKPDEPRRAIAEHQARICLLGLRELQKTWGFNNWVLQLFFQYLDEATAARLQVNDINLGVKPRGSEKVSSSSRSHQDGQSSLPQDNSPVASDLMQDYIGGPGPINNNPWSWSMEEVDNFLNTQIESGFAFGEGNILNFGLGQSPGDYMGNIDDVQMLFMNADN